MTYAFFFDPLYFFWFRKCGVVFYVHYSLLLAYPLFSFGI